MTLTVRIRQNPNPATTALARFAVIGHPVKHSRSPSIHQQFAQQMKVALTYQRLEVPLDGFKSAVEQFFASGGRGLNVTVPFKLEAWELARNHLSERAKRAQAVNTLWQQEGVLHGCNTDGVGLISDLNRLGVRCKGARILMIGAGGAARGVLGPLLETGCTHIHIVNRTAARAHALVNEWIDLDPSNQQKMSAGALSEAANPAGWDLVINASASSLGGAAPEVPKGLYAVGAWAYDMMYSSTATAFMAQAQADGATYLSDGLGMLVGQAAESFFIWHGKRPDIQPVLRHLRQELNRTP